jgi:hypothetical protein
MPDDAERTMDDGFSADAVYTEPILGWRFWRLRRLETFGADRPLRLAAAGRFGIPKFWEPRAATKAVCSSYRTAHEAPWPSCRCGIYGLRERDLAERAVLKYSRGELESWAVGRVSLWGRIVESEHGWRAEYAYPYELVVFTADDRVAAELRDLYAVDVSASAPPAPRIRRRGRRDEERAAKARVQYDEWIRRLGEATAASLASSEQELAQAVGEAMRFRIRLSSRVVAREVRVERNRWDARA